MKLFFLKPFVFMRTFVLAFLFFASVFILSDFKAYKVFNYNEKSRVAGEDCYFKRALENGFVCRYLVFAEDNYLGGLLVFLGDAQNYEGKLRFEVAEAESGETAHSDEFDLGFISTEDYFWFGVPAISNSQGKTFSVILDATFEDEANFDGEINNFPEITKLKYVFPRELILGKPKTLLSIGGFRIAEVLSEKFGRIVLLSLGFVVTMFFVPKIVEYLQTEFTNKNNNYWEKIVGIAGLVKFKKLVGIPVVLIILLSGFSGTYYLGGDDTRLYYLYPLEFIKNYSSNIASDVAISGLRALLPPTAILPFSFLMLFFDWITESLNFQAIAYWLNITGGFVTFYLLASWVVPIKKRYAPLVYGVSSLMYVFSIYNFYVLLNSYLISVYLLSTFPLFLYLFLRGVNEKKYHYIAGSALISSVFAFFTAAFPWFAAAAISLAPLLFYQLKRCGFYMFRPILFFLFLTIILNFHWLVFVPYSSSVAGGAETDLASSSFREENTKGIISTARYNNVYYPLFNSFHKDLQEEFEWPYLPIFRSWYEKIMPLNAIFVVVVLLSAIIVEGLENRRRLYVLFFCYLVSVYFFTVNITDFGTSVFAWLSNNLPGFIVFRNMYDKFAYAVSLTFPLLMAGALNVVLGKIKTQKVKFLSLSFVAIVVLLGLKPFLFGEFSSQPIWTTQTTFNKLSAFNKDFVDMTRDIRLSDADAKYLSLPLSIGNTFAVRDANSENNYYAGVSPLLVLSGRNDFSGILSFDTYGDDVLRMLDNKEYEGIGRILQLMNVRYVIVNHALNEDLIGSFIYPDGLTNSQNEVFYETILGRKIKDYGESYSLYEINTDYYSEKIFLTGKESDVFWDDDKSGFTKVSDTEYKVFVSESENNLVFLEPFNKGWRLYSGDEVVSEESHISYMGFGNVWDLSSYSEYGNNGGELRLVFAPRKYFWPSNTVSILGYIFAGTFIFSRIKSRDKYE